MVRKEVDWKRWKDEEEFDYSAPFCYNTRTRRKAGIPFDFIKQRLIRRVGAKAACIYVLLDWCKNDDDGLCYPCYNTLMRYSAFNGSEVLKALTRLEDAGLVCITKKKLVSKRTGKKYGYARNHYELL